MAMPARQLLLEVSKLTELQSVRVAIKESFKGAAIAGFTTLAGGLLLGPVGLALGGTIGGCSAAVMSNKKFKPLSQIILYDLTRQQQNDLIAAIRVAISSIPIHNALEFATNIAQDPAMATTVAVTVISFLNSQLGMEIVD